MPVLALDKVNLRWGIQNHWKESGWRKEGDRGSKVIQELYRGMDVSTDSAKGHSDYELKQERAAITVAREGKGFTLRNLSKCGKKACAQNERHTIFDEVRRFGFFEANPQS